MSALHPDELGDEVLLLRPPVPEDAPLHSAAARESWPEVGRWLSWVHEGYRDEESADWIGSVIEARARGDDYEWFIFLRDTGRFLGGVSLRPLEHASRTANCGYWLRSTEAGKGYMTRAVRFVLAYGFERLGLERIEIVMQAENVASKRVAEKVGARFEGVLRNRIPWPTGNVDGLGYAIVPGDL